jgi:hypothetical protein
VPPTVVALAPIAPPAVPSFAEAVAIAAPAPVAIPAVAPAPERKATPKPVLAEAPSPAPVTLAMIAAAAPEAPAAFAMFMPKKAPAPAPAAAKAAKPRHVPAALVRPNLRHGDSVMQLGAYRTPAQVSQAWAKLTQRYPALRAYLPLRARFDSSKGTFWRLSVQGFDSEREAVLRCRALKNRGGNCFVRDFAGDMPVQIASR